MRWYVRLWRRLTYAHDPEAHRLLQEVLKRVDALAKQAHLSITEVGAGQAEPVRHDCGHLHASYASNTDTGRTECGDCYTDRWANYRRPPPPRVGPNWR